MFTTSQPYIRRYILAFLAGTPKILMVYENLLYAAYFTEIILFQLALYLAQMQLVFISLQSGHHHFTIFVGTYQF